MTDIAVWLESRGLGHLVDLFKENDIDCEVVLQLTDGDLRDLGLSVGNRRKLLSAIARESSKPKLVETQGASIAASAGTPEWRQLTLMFCDLVDSTALSHRLDPEDLRPVLQSYQACCANSISRLGGTISRYLGDGILACFGYPSAHEDDAERSIHAALEIVREVAQLRPRADLILRVRVGIATGKVVVGDLEGEGTAEERAIVGETPNLAARLQSIAEPNTVVISSSTYRLISGLFDVLDLGPFDLKGFSSPVRAWRVSGEATAESRFAATHAVSMAPIVGRQQEIELLLDRWEQARDGEGQVILISGEPGIGKSRLVSALRERMRQDDCFHLSYHGSQHRQTSALFPVISQVERNAAITRDDTNEDKLDKLERLLKDSRYPISETVPILATLLSISTEARYPPLQLTPKQIKDKTFQTLALRLEEMCEQKPILLVVEDAQWIDPTSLELIEQTIDRVKSLSALAIIVFRPEFVVPWIAQPHITSLSLNRLSRRQAAVLVEQLTVGKKIPGETVDQIVTRADGVPLFLEELTKTVIEFGVAAEREDRSNAKGSPGQLSVPASLHDSLMARLDRMSTVKQVTQLAATIGRTFSLELLRSVCTIQATVLDDALVQLVEAGILYREQRPSGAFFQFKHALLQDVAYQSLLRSTRRKYHNDIARTLAEKFPEIADVHPEVLAYHFSEGGQAIEAIRYWMLAGERATKRSANIEAVSQINSALALLGTVPEHEEKTHQEYKLLLSLIPPLVATRGYSAVEVEQTFTRALLLAERIGDTSRIFPVLYSQYAYHLMTGQIRKAAALAEEFAVSYRRHQAVDLAPIGERLDATCRFLLGSLGAARLAIEKAVASYDPEIHRNSAFAYGHDHLATGLGILSLILWQLGFTDQAGDRHRQALVHARSLSHLNSLGVVFFYGAALHALRRDESEVKIYAAQLSQLGGEHQLALWSAVGTFFHGLALSEQKHFHEGSAIMQQGLATLKNIHVGHFRPLFLSWLAEAYGKGGEPERGLVALDEARTLMNSGGERWMEADSYRIKGELLMLSGGEAAVEAEECAWEAVRISRAQQSLSLELRAATSLSRLWFEQGKLQEGRELVKRVCASFSEGFATKDFAEARAVLDKYQ